MGASKTELFTVRENEIADLAKAFAHPARVSIVQYLLKANTCINVDLVNELGLAQATVSQHLLALKKAGIIKGIIHGPRKSYCIDSHNWEKIKEHFMVFFNQLDLNQAENECD